MAEQGKGVIVNIEDCTLDVRRHRPIFAQALVGGYLASSKFVTVVTGVKNGRKLNKMTVNQKILQIDDSNCSWDEKDLARLSEVEAKVKTFKINSSQCIDDYESIWAEAFMSEGAWNTLNDVDEIIVGAVALIVKQSSKEMDDMLFAGDSSKDPDEFDGFAKILRDSGESIKLKGVELTKANVLDEIEKGFLKMPKDVLGDRDAKIYIYVSALTHLNILMALGSKESQVVNPNWSVIGSDEQATIKYLGKELVVAPLSDSEFIIADAYNLLFLTDLTSDVEKLEVEQGIELKNRDKIYAKGRMRGGAGIPFPNECVIYSSEVDETEAGGDKVRGVGAASNPFQAFGLPETAKDLESELRASGDSLDVEDLKTILDIERKVKGGRTTIVTLLEKLISEKE